MGREVPPLASSPFQKKGIWGFLCLLLWEGTRKRTGGTEQSFLWLGNVSLDPVKPQSKSGKLEKRGPNPNSSSHTLGHEPSHPVCQGAGGGALGTGSSFPVSGHPSWTSCWATEKRESIHSRHTERWSAGIWKRPEAEVLSRKSWLGGKVWKRKGMKDLRDGKQFKS